MSTLLAFSQAFWIGFTSGDDCVCLFVFTYITIICLCTECYPDVKTGEKTLKGEPQCQQQSKAGVTPQQECIFSLNSWEKKDGESQSILVSGLESVFNSLVALPEVSDSVAVVQFCFSTKTAETTCVQESGSFMLVVCIALCCFSQPSTQAFC